MVVGNDILGDSLLTCSHVGVVGVEGDPLPILQENCNGSLIGVDDVLDLVNMVVEDGTIPVRNKAVCGKLILTIETVPELHILEFKNFLDPFQHDSGDGAASWNVVGRH